jgi:hypothetical protein
LAVVEARVFRNARPEPLDHAPSQPTNRENVDPAADVLFCDLAVGLRQSTWGEEYEDFLTGTPRPNSAWRCLAACGFARSHRPAGKAPLWSR